MQIAYLYKNIESMKNIEKPLENFTAFLFGKEHADNLEMFYNELLALESDDDFFSDENQLASYLLISYAPDNFDVKYRKDLPKDIQEKITNIADGIFKKT